jgi:hypothetical protein
MNWSDERYVRLYTRDTPEFAALPWQARLLWAALLRKMDRAGVLAVRPGPRRIAMVAALLQVPEDFVALGLAALLDDGCLVESELGYCAPNFIEAQECEMSDAQRQRESRGRRRAKGMVRVRTGGMDTWEGDGSQNVTTGHDGSQRVTPSRAVPSRAVPKETTLSTSSTEPSNDNNGCGAKVTPLPFVALQLPPKPGPADEVFAYWRQAMGKPRAVFDAKRRKLVEARLKDGFSVETLKAAIDGYRRDPFSMGKNDRNKAFNDLALICRDAERVERYLANKPKTPPKTMEWSPL